MPSSSARCSQLPRAVDKLPFYVALKKLRDHLRGNMPDLDVAEVTFPNLDLKVEPKREKPDVTVKPEVADIRPSTFQLKVEMAAENGCSGAKRHRKCQRKTSLVAENAGPETTSSSTSGRGTAYFRDGTVSPYFQPSHHPPFRYYGDLVINDISHQPKLETPFDCMEYGHMPVDLSTARSRECPTTFYSDKS